MLLSRIGCVGSKRNRGIEDGTKGQRESGQKWIGTSNKNLQGATASLQRLVEDNTRIEDGTMAKGVRTEVERDLQ